MKMKSVLVLIMVALAGCSEGHSADWQRGYNYATRHGSDPIMGYPVGTGEMSWCLLQAPYSLRGSAADDWENGCVASLNRQGL